jgi:hypothetical protein
MKSIFILSATLCLISLTTLFSGARAESDHAIDKAMKDTQDLLRDKTQRDELIKKDSKAREAEAKVNSVTGGDAANNQRINEIAADALPALMKVVGNDPAKAMELLQKAQTDPEGFYKSLPPEIRSQIRSVSSDIEAKGAAKKSP